MKRQFEQGPAQEQPREAPASGQVHGRLQESAKLFVVYRKLVDAGEFTMDIDSEDRLTIRDKKGTVVFLSADAKALEDWYASIGSFMGIGDETFETDLPDESIN